MAPKTMKQLDYHAYTVALLCPLEVELSAARYLLDEEHHRLPSVPNDPNQYILGEMSSHNVVIASLPEGSQGTASAAAVAINMSRTFVRVQTRLLVGIGGGVPSEKVDIRLGDVVVGIPTGIYGGVVQYDLGKQNSTGFQRKGFLAAPPPAYLHAVTTMKSSHRAASSKVPAFLNDMLQKHPKLRQYRRPPTEQDVLFKPSYKHTNDQASCHRCDRARTEKRASREPANEPFIHYGLIASGGCVMKDAVERDRISQECGDAICFEMEAAGLMNDFSCLVIRGISDYSDSHKNDEWHAYAATAAAALAKELLEHMGGYDVHKEERLVYRSSISRDEEDNSPVQRRAAYNPDREQTFETLLNSLSFARQDARLLNIRAAYAQTCQWVSNQPQFTEWRDKTKIPEHHGFLWIKGKPGSGKSTIMKKLHSATKGKTYEKTLSYFFNARAPGLLEKSSLGMYRSLTHQLLKALPYLQDSFLEIFASKVTGNNVDEWTIPELQGFLIHVVETLGKQPLTIFIDALDEGEEDDVRQMVMFLEELGETALFNKAQVMVCLSSRHYPHISVRKGVSLTVEGQIGHDDDIALYVRSHLNEDDSPEMERFRRKVCEKASGVFLWVFLVIPILNTLYDKGKLALMAESLDDIPSELDALFAQILGRDKDDRAQSILLFQWTLFAERPMSPTELFYAVAVELWDSGLPDKETIERYILNCSKGLAEVSKSEPPTVYFIHETVRGFLLQNNGLAEIQPELRDSMFGSSHNQLANICRHYLSSIHESHTTTPRIPCKRTRSKGFQNYPEKETISTRFPFLQYAVNFIFNHAEHAEAQGFSQSHWLEDFNASASVKLQEWIKYRNIFQRYKVRRYTPKATLLYILSEQNLYNLARLLIGRSNVNCHGERYGNALQAACVNGHQEIAHLLVNAGADVNTQAGEYHGALLAAILSRNDTIVRLILSKGGTVPRDHVNKWLLSTVWRKYALGVEVLLRLGADANSKDGRSHSALWTACYLGQPQIVQILLDNGVDVNEHGDTPLKVACKEGYEDIVQMLVDNGVEVKVQGAKTLLIATSRGYERIVQILLDNGADAKEQGGQALASASSRGHKAIVQMLIDNGFDVKGQGGEALMNAISKGHGGVVQILLDNGADANSQGWQFGSAIQEACSLQDPQLQIVQMLLDHGANVNAQDGLSVTALQRASSSGHQQIVQILLDRGANANAQAGSCGTALYAACRLRYAETQLVQILLDNGADVNMKHGIYPYYHTYYCCTEHMQIFQLLGQGTNPNLTILNTRCDEHQQILRMLLDHGATWTNAKGAVEPAM